MGVGGVDCRGQGFVDLLLGREDFFVDLELVGFSFGFGLGISDTLGFIFVGDKLGFGLGISDALDLSLLICDTICFIFAGDALDLSLLICDTICLLFISTNTKLERFILNRHLGMHFTLIHDVICL